MLIIVLRFYKYVAPLGLKSPFIFHKKYNNISYLARPKAGLCERDRSETTRKATHKCRRHAVEVAMRVM
jgi:hypothetical protein